MESIKVERFRERRRARQQRRRKERVNKHVIPLLETKVIETLNALPAVHVIGETKLMKSGTRKSCVAVSQRGYVSVNRRLKQHNDEV